MFYLDVLKVFRIPVLVLFRIMYLGFIGFAPITFTFWEEIIMASGSK